jgi:biotin carboxyl carrier protein
VRCFARLDAAGGFADTLGSCARFDDLRGAAVHRSERAGSGKIIAAMHAQVARIAVECGQRVARGELVATLESMKIEHHVLASVAGTISAIAVRVGAQVAPGQLLLQIIPDSVAGHTGTANAEERND